MEKPLEGPFQEGFKGKEVAGELVSENERSEAKLLTEKLSRTSLSVDEKVELVLIKEGVKPSTDMSLNSGTWYPGEDQKSVDLADVETVKGILEELGLSFEIEEPKITHGAIADKEHDYEFPLREAVMVLVGRDAESLELIKNAHQFGDPGDFGRAYGFPETAIEAYVKGSKIPINAVPSDVQKSDAYMAGRFAYSSEHWRDELEVGQRWADALKKYPDLFAEFKDEFLDSLKGLDGS